MDPINIKIFEVSSSVGERGQYANVFGVGSKSRIEDTIAGEVVDLQSIVLFCLATYGTIGLLWVAFSKIPSQDARASWLKIVLYCLTWASMSVGMHVLNKTLVVALSAPSLITAFQMLMSFVAMLVYSWSQLVTANRQELLRWMIVPAFFAGMLISSLYSYEFISLSLLTVVRNLAPLVVLPIEIMIMPANKAPQITLSVVASILVMLFGAVTYAGGLQGISWIGVMIATLNMALAVSDRTLQRRLLTTDCSSLAPETCTLMSNFFGMFPTLGIAAFTGELSGAMAPTVGKVSAWADPRVLVLLVLSGGIGLGICYFGFACQREISATSFMVLQNISKVAVVAMGIVFFQDPIKSPYMVLGLLMSIGGSSMYGKAQMDIAKEVMEKAKLLKDSDNQSA